MMALKQLKLEFVIKYCIKALKKKSYKVKLLPCCVPDTIYEIQYPHTFIMSLEIVNTLAVTFKIAFVRDMAALNKS